MSKDMEQRFGDKFLKSYTVTNDYAYPMLDKKDVNTNASHDPIYVDSYSEILQFITDELKAQKEGFVKELEEAWSFNEYQEHTHTWHDKRKFIEKLKED